METNSGVEILKISFHRSNNSFHKKNNKNYTMFEVLIIVIIVQYYHNRILVSYLSNKIEN